MSDLVIRPAKTKDAIEIASVHVNTWRTAYRDLMPDAFLNSLSVEKRAQKWEGYILEKENSTQIFIAEKDSKIIGFCSVGKCRDDDMDDKTGELWAIYVDPNSQSQGVGIQLMNAGLNHLWALGFNKATLWVLVSNTKTRKWYESKGWTLEGKTKVDQRDCFNIEEIRYLIKKI